MFKNRSLTAKITISVVSYIILIGIIGNVILFVYLQNIIFHKAEQMDMANIKTVKNQLDRNFENVFSLVVYCAADPQIRQVLTRQDRSRRELVLDSLDIQNRINTFLQANPAGYFVNKLILFNNDGIYVYGQSRLPGDSLDRERIYSHPLFTGFIANNLPWTSGFDRSISKDERDCYILLFRITNSNPNNPDAFLHIEIGIDMITDIFRDYQASSGVFAQIPETGKVILDGHTQLVIPSEGNLGYVPENAEFPLRFRQKGRTYRLDRMPLENDRLVLYNQEDITNLAVDDKRILYTVLITVTMSLLAAVGLAMALSMYLTKPIYALISRIRKITMENDFSPDPKIEKRGDEIGNIGKAVNEMSGSIGRFLVEKEEQYRRQKKTEIALLQTQINPHFLYNTLDSIQWMAKIQNNHSVADMIHRLISLLRNIIVRADSGATNGSGTKITLAEELLIIEDYVELISLRFMGAIEVFNNIPETFLSCLIPKFILQPLVENAIFHGIRPSEKHGTITLNASAADGFLDIIVEDSGVGMSPEQLESIKTADRERKRDNPSLNNIGIANVETRLKLLYGDSCGLFYESRPGEYTKVTVRIIMER